MEKYRKFYKKILISIICILIIVSIINIVVDPYVVFHTPTNKFTNLKPDAKRQERITKPIEFKLDKRKIDTVFIGTSRVDWAFDVDDFKKKTGKNASNMAVVGMNVEEYIDFTKKVLEIHPEIKNIYLGLDFYTFNKAFMDKQKREGFNKNPKLTTSELATVLFASDTTVSSFITIAKNISCKEMSKMYNHKGLIYVFNNPIVHKFFVTTVRTYYDRYVIYEINTSYYDKLAELKLYCKNKDINLYFFHTNGHAVDLTNLYIMNLWEIFTQWKKDLTKITDLYDFYYINPISTEKVTNGTGYFYDAAHGTPKLGALMMDKFLGINDTYGRINTRDNIEQFTQQDTKNLKKWMKENPDWVKTINEIKKYEEAKQEEEKNAL